ncbi:uncharacterized protein LOC100907819 [Galendromus occidentalis]|uniref:Uncharacterized protein LOC100907819 n=1 Tax=Galendromus occidentalis TaxID=34638 RepID=A0AAJ6QX21_9ACAR|nr:uncharacterized protein LOC100907819 [Galendromus occidentalis]
MERSTIVGVLFLALIGMVSAKPPEGYRASLDTYHNHNHLHHQQQQSQPLRQNHAQHHGLEHGQLPAQQPLQDSRAAQLVPLHDVNRVRGVYVNGKPVVAGVPQAVSLTPVKHQPQAQAKAPYDLPIPAAEYYDEIPPYSGPQSAYIPTAPYPASIYGRPPFWVRLQRWNPFSRLYRTTYTVGAPEYSPAYGYVVPPLMVLPTPPNSKIEPVYSQPLNQPPTPQRRYSIF